MEWLLIVAVSWKDPSVTHVKLPTEEVCKAVAKASIDTVKFVDSTARVKTHCMKITNE